MEITDNPFVVSASSVQSASRKLLGKGLVTVNDGIWSISDMFFGMWIRSIYEKYSNN